MQYSYILTKGGIVVEFFRSLNAARAIEYCNTVYGNDWKEHYTLSLIINLK